MGSNRSHVSWAPKDLLRAARNFESDTFDLVLLAFVRPIVLGLLSWLAVAVGTPKLDDLVRARPDGGCNGGSSTSPLLINAAPTGAQAETCNVCNAPEGITSGTAVAASTADQHDGRRSAASAGLVLSTDVKEEHLASQKRKERAELRKNVVCGLMFLFTSGIQVFVGIKCFDDH